MTPRRLVDLAKFTASLTLRQRRSVSSSGAAGCNEVPVLDLDIPQKDVKNTASEEDTYGLQIHPSAQLIEDSFFLCPTENANPDSQLGCFQFKAVQTVGSKLEKMIFLPGLSFPES